MQQIARSTPLMGGRTSAIDFAAIGNHTHHYGPHSQQRTTMSISGIANAGAGPDGSSNTDAPDDTNGNDSGSAEADEDSATVGDPDVLAPSDITFDSDKGQTGLHQINNHETETPNKEYTESHEATTVAHNAEGLASSREDVFVSDQDDYNGVDLISESGDEEPTVEQLEEKAIIEYGEDHAHSALPLSPPNSPSDIFSISSARLGQVDFNLDPFLTDDIFFQEQINLLDPDQGANHNGYFGSTDDFTFTTPSTETRHRRVHFAEPLMIPSEASKAFLTDLNNISTSSARLIGNSSNQKDGISPEGDQDFCEGQPVTSGEDMRFETRTGAGWTPDTFESMDDGNDYENDDGAEGSVGSSSGYETDYGETTDEEDVPASATARPSAVLRDSSASELNNRLVGPPPLQGASSRLPPSRRWGPKLGSWVADPTKPIAVVGSSGTDLIILPARRPTSREGKVFSTIASSGQSSVQASPRAPTAKMVPPSYPTVTDDSEMDRSEMSSQGTATPMISASPNVMISGLGLGSGNLLSGHAMGPPEAFFPFQSIGVDGSMVLDDDVDDYEDDEDDEAEGLLNIEDFIDFGEDSEESDHEAESISENRQSPAMTSPTQVSAEPASLASSPTQSSTKGFLDHLDKGVVTAFRRNQYGYNTNPFGQSTKSPFRIPNALKANAFVSTTTPLGLPKKRKLSGGFGIQTKHNHAFTKRRTLSRRRPSQSIANI
ncbi:MAG: hypothetical protein Q9166_002450 [cf. Caloplaca sp. 2 TL-2023]